MIAAVAEAAGAVRPSGAVRGSVPVANILVASADRAVRSLVEATLAEGRVSVASAGEAERALDQARAHPPQLAFVDAELPGGAIAFCQMLRGTDEAAATRIVMLVGRGAQVDRAAAAKAGVDDFLAKPFSSLQLMSKVRDYVPDALAG
jgi:DNA-binding response OmpR family regulator